MGEGMFRLHRSVLAELCRALPSSAELCRACRARNAITACRALPSSGNDGLHRFHKSVWPRVSRLLQTLGLAVNNVANTFVQSTLSLSTIHQAIGRHDATDLL